MNKELQRFVPIAEVIAKTFGKNCEVVIHDLSIPQNSVVYAVNNHVTGRKIGQPFEHLIKQVLLSQDFNNDNAANYLTVTSDGREIKSSTVLIRDSRDKVIGALCINYDLRSMKYMKEFIDDFVAVEVDKTQPEAAVFDNVIDIVDDLIDKIISSSDVDNMKRKDKIELVNFMDKKGVFLIKGALEKVAEKLGISKVTVYSYLDEIKKAEGL